MPVFERQKRVGPEETEKLAVYGQVPLECDERIKSVVGRVVGRALLFRRVGEGESKAGFVGDGEACHGDAIFEACGRTEGLERLRAHGGEEDGIEIESGLCGARDGEMTAVGRVETSSEKRDAGTIGR